MTYVECLDGALVGEERVNGSKLNGKGIVKLKLKKEDKGEEEFRLWVSCDCPPCPAGEVALCPPRPPFVDESRSSAG